MNDSNTQPRFLAAIWLLLGVIILIGNTITTFIIWRRKVQREKSKFGLKCHAAWNLIGINATYTFLGLLLIITSMIRLTKSGTSISETTCDIFGFFYSFLFHFAAVGVTLLQVDKLYCLIKPFAYHAFSRRKSKVPLIVLFCCSAYGTIIGVFPLTKLGSYSSKTTYTSCLPSWDKNAEFYTCFFLKFMLFLLTAAASIGILRQKLKIVKKRREMRVATSHPNETIIFVLSVSSLFAICWSPNLVSR